MTNLAEKLTAPDVRGKVVKACVDLVESEVSGKKGISGFAIKAGYKVIKALRPGAIPHAVNSLLPDFAGAMQPLYDKSTQGADDAASAFGGYITSNPDETADALLTVTDSKAVGATNPTVRKTYEKLRPTAKANVSAAVPGLASALTPFL